MLKQRIITSVVLIPVVLALIFFAPLNVFSPLVAGVILLGAWEWSALMELKNKLIRLAYVGCIGVLLGLVHYNWPIELIWKNKVIIQPVIYILAAAFSWWIIATVLVFSYPKKVAHGRLKLLIRALVGVLTLVPLWLALNVLRSFEYQTDTLAGTALIFMVLGIVWSADIGAYFSGKRFGKRKLMPHVSPNKTLEGLVGGVIASAVFVFISSAIAEIQLAKALILAALAILVALFSAVGDLLESMFKREAGMKDSGSCLPGHGGIMDRIDSLTAAAPVFVVLVWAMYW